MKWNVVVTTRDEGFDQAEEELADLGEIARTNYFNVLVMAVDDPDAFLEALADRARMIPDLTDRVLSRVAPARHTFEFQDAEEFRTRVVAWAREIAPELAGRSFYVRMHRRGFREDLSSHEEEQRIAGAVFDALEEEGRTTEVDFDDPDAVVAVETVGTRAGLSVWSRDELERWPILDPG